MTQSYCMIIWFAERSLGSHTFLQLLLQVTTLGITYYHYGNLTACVSRGDIFKSYKQDLNLNLNPGKFPFPSWPLLWRSNIITAH